VEAGLGLEPAAPISRAVREALVDDGVSPFDAAMHHEVRAHIEAELAHVPEPFRTAVILRDIEDLSYEEIAEVTETTLGTVKSRLTRGREFLRQRLERYVSAIAAEMGVEGPKRAEGERAAPMGRRAEVVG